MPLVYRVMTRDGDKPMVGDMANKLGVRPDKDLPVSEGVVVPNTGGLSVGPGWRRLPYSLIPKRLRHLVPQARGSNKCACWKMGEGPFASGSVASRLSLRVEHENHGLVEPEAHVTLAEYQRALAATVELWVIDET